MLVTSKEAVHETAATATSCSNRAPDSWRWGTGRSGQRAIGDPRRASQNRAPDAPIGPWFEQFPPQKPAPLATLRGIVEATVALGTFTPPEAFDDPEGQLSGTNDEYRVLRVKDESEIDEGRVKRRLPAAVAARRCDQRLVVDSFRATAALTSALKPFVLIFSPSWKSMARLVLPSRLELNRPAGSCSDAPLANVTFT
jgi:hypothetical protein